MAEAQRVLLVDGPTETAQVLRAVLGRRGVEINRVRGDRLTRERPLPHLLVIHEDTVTSARVPELPDVPRILIGTAHVADDAPAPDCYLQHPFEYPELIAAIDRLLDDAA